MSGILTIAVSGLNNASLRIANAASNIVNASSTGALPTSPGGNATSFQPQDVVSTPGADGGVNSSLQPRNPAFVAVPDPTSPNANAAGLVAAPNVSLDNEIINVQEATTAYRADLAVISATDETQKKLLDAIA